jgi:2,5-diketo-D-gluconate reductase B
MMIKAESISIPRLGLGTFRNEGAVCQRAVESGLAIGYRHIDTAARYANEVEVGAAIAGSGLARGDVFVTTKVWHDQLSPEAIKASLNGSLDRLKLDYVDLFMVHWPSPGMDLPAVMAAMIELRETGRSRAIGVCNFNLSLLRQVVEEIKAPIEVLQIEYHPFLDQSRMLDYVRRRGIAMTAYAPLAKGHAPQDETLQAIGAKYGATGAQIALTWLLGQEGVVAIPKATGRENQLRNFEATRITLSDADRAVIAALPKDHRVAKGPVPIDWNS